MENFSNEKELRELDYPQNEEDQNNFPQNDIFNIDNINMNDPNYMNYDNYNYNYDFGRYKK